MTSLEAMWVAGLLEGEGSFRWTIPRSKAGIVRTGHAVAQVSMSDRDVVERFAALFGKRAVPSHHHREPNRKPMFSTVLHGRKAVGCMMMVLPLMGERRSEKIRSILKTWRSFGSALPLSAPRVCRDCGTSMLRASTVNGTHAYRVCIDCMRRRNRERWRAEAIRMGRRKYRRAVAKAVRNNEQPPPVPTMPPDHPVGADGVLGLP